ncbi:DNA protecting protein DprA [Cupriavidus gilardii J11]|uniref:DNA protecting protein DprA n=1 Tax=Cupriavidus gilardii J11 TaxID=936133 RepID=A0A562BBD2_9BURK|nr:DNA-processing protein DprA [Cupriavidus gilardii]TWG82496.1 DNA protecting protein DprA [Cupriavidus gilardii J11]
MNAPSAAPPAGVLPDEDTVAWLRLASVPGLGRIAARRLLAALGLPRQIFATPAAELRQWLSPEQVRALLASPDNERAARMAKAVEWARGPDHHLLTLADATYPRGLLDLADPPLVLYAQGRLDLLQSPGLAVVGARGASMQGLRDADRFARAFGEAGFVVVSGLAMGIDGAAHEAALAGRHGTIAVMGTGIDCIYPACHRPLAARIAADGLLLTEFDPGTAARSNHFPQRNRLIAALSKGVLVVEAALRSGSLITARLAADLGREVFAMPGSVHAPLARGCHRLIRDGAKLVETPEDVLEEFGPALGGGRGSAAVPAAGPPAAAPADPLGAALAYDPVDIDTLCQRAGMPADAVSAALLGLELNGAVERLPGNRYRRLG